MNLCREFPWIVWESHGTGKFYSNSIGMGKSMGMTGWQWKILIFPLPTHSQLISLWGLNIPVHQTNFADSLAAFWIFCLRLFYNIDPSTRQHLSYGDCLEVKREYYRNSSVLDCVTECLQSAAHLYEQFLLVKQIGFVTLGLLHCV